MSLLRRAFLRRCAGLAACVAVPAFVRAAGSRMHDDPFRLGVASGSPRPDSVILWTRLLSDPLNAESIDPVPYSVGWEVAEDERFTRIVRRGSTEAHPASAHSVHVNADGLRPDRWYWYRFLLGDAVSPLGRTRTAPADDSMPAGLRFAFASCQNWEHGEYAAHRHIAASAPDLVVFLGDYIYEHGPYTLEHPSSPRRGSQETVTLAQYRARYAQYKSDPSLQASHQAAPWLVTWDDHEVANDYANDRDARLDPLFPARRAAAYQAFYEHMPIRRGHVLAAGANSARLTLHDRINWGRLAQFHLLDTRQYRDYQACQPAHRGGSAIIDASCSALHAADRSLLGWEQERWLEQGLSASPARWNVIAQQTLMAQFGHGHAAPDDSSLRIWNDGWDGYPAARQRLLGSLVKHNTANPLVISGDVHTFYAADLRPDFTRPAARDNPVIATEFCGTSISSSSRAQTRTEQLVAINPHVRYGRSDRRGYVMMELGPKSALATFQALDDVKRADSLAFPIARFMVESGRAGLTPLT